MKKIPSSNELCKLDNRNQRMLKNGKITKKEYNKRKKRIHTLYRKQTKEVDLIKKLVKQQKKRKGK